MMLAKLNKIVDTLCDKISYIALGALFFLMIVTGVHVILRKITPISVPDSIGLTELSMVLIVFCTMGYLQMKDGHVRVDMFVGRFPLRAKLITTGVIYLVGAIILFVMFYASVLQVPIQYDTNLSTGVLKIPIWPFYIVMCVGLLMYVASLTLNAVEALCGVVKGVSPEEEGE
jgi:TRAP-type C4-dicarboxylate transport system permease small subunit